MGLRNPDPIAVRHPTCQWLLKLASAQQFDKHSDGVLPSSTSLLHVRPEMCRPGARLKMAMLRNKRCAAGIYYSSVRAPVFYLMVYWERPRRELMTTTFRALLQDLQYL